VEYEYGLASFTGKSRRPVPERADKKANLSNGRTHSVHISSRSAHTHVQLHPFRFQHRPHNENLPPPESTEKSVGKWNEKKKAPRLQACV